METLQTAIKNDPNNATAHYQLGRHSRVWGTLEGAESEWREAIRLRPDLFDAQRSLALSGHAQGDMSTLEQAATQIITCSPNARRLCATRRFLHQSQAAYRRPNDIARPSKWVRRVSLGYVQLGNLKFVQRQYADAGKSLPASA